MRQVKFWGIMLILAAAIPLGCAPMGEQWSGASVRISKSALRVADIARIQVSVAGPGIDEPINQALTLENGQWRGLIKGIPAGSNRRFVAVAYDDTDQALFEGLADNVVLVAGKTAGVLITLQQKTPPNPFHNTVPVIDALTATSLQVAPLKSIDLAVTAHDDDNDDVLSFTWTSQAGTFRTPSLAVTTWTAPQTAGTYNLVITVSDNHNAKIVVSTTVIVASESASANVEATFNTWPRVQSMFAEPGRVKRGEPIDLRVVADDLDGDVLRYQWKAEGTGCVGQFNDSNSITPTWTSPTSLPDNSRCSLKVIVQDGKGGESQGTLVVQLGESIQAQIVPTSSVDNTPPVSSVNPPAGTIVPFLLNLTISCDDSGSGCSRIVYTLDGTTPSFDPPNGTIVQGDRAYVELFSTDPSTIFHLQFAAEDKAGNRESPKSAVYHLQ